MISFRQADILPSIKESDKHFFVSMVIKSNRYAVVVHRPVPTRMHEDKDPGYVAKRIDDLFQSVIKHFYLRQYDKDQAISMSYPDTQMRMEAIGHIITYIYYHYLENTAGFEEHGDDPGNKRLEFML